MFATKLEAALSARLYFDVFPVAPNSKVPLLKENWQQIATRDEAVIRQWWADNPDANIGGVTTDKLVFDIDKRNQGWDTWAFLKITEDFPNTLCATTAGGGAHVIYQMRTGQQVKNGAHKAGQGVDIKGDGGYIVVPGSTIDGKAYEWDNNTPMAFAPEWAAERFKGSKPKKTDSAGKRLLEEDDTARELFEQWVLKHAPTAHDGEVDDTTYKVAARGYDFGCSEQTVFDIVSEWDETNCFPQNNSDRLPVVVESAGRNRENAIGSKHPLASPFEAVEDVGTAPSSEPTSSKPKSTEGMKLERYFAAADRALSSQAEPLVKGVLDRGAMSILYGESNTGKTLMAVDVAFHVAANLAWAKRKVRPGAVVYVAAEGGAGVYKRLAALRQRYPDIGDIPLFIIKFPVDLLHGKEHGAELVRLCRQAAEEAGCALELIVIDTLSRAMSGGDENSSTDMGAMVKSFDALREATGAHLMVIHHSGKDRARGARGHSLLRAATDTEIEIERGKLTVTKQRDMEGDFEQAFELPKVTIGLDADGEPIESCVVKLLSKQEAAAVEVQPTGAEVRILKRAKAFVGDDTGAVFRWEDLLEIGPNNRKLKGEDRTTIVGHLKALSNKGFIRKAIGNKYYLE